MSDTFRQAMMNKLPRLPPTRAPWADEPQQEDEELEELQDDVGDLQLEPRPTSTSSKRQIDYSPLSASSYFSQAISVTPQGSPCHFRAYYTPSDQTKASPSSSPNAKNGTLLVCHHGAGASGLSFATLAKEVGIATGGEIGVLSVDARGHGKTTVEGSKEVDTDMSLPTLLNDFMSLIQHLFPDPKSAPALLLMGHSMGAAPILSAAPALQELGYGVVGVVVLDVVEGTAVEALPLMKTILAQRPTSFKSVEASVEWHVTSNSIRNVESARISVPSFLSAPPDMPKGDQRQLWRTDLLATAPYWAKWYKGLSSRFLSAKCAKLLVLAGQERLDKELMVGQMQGKFQLEVLPDVGHYLHEDAPEKLASTVVAFWKRNTRPLVLPPKLGTSPAT